MGGREEADVVDVGLRAGHHRADRLALGEGAVDDPDVGDHAAVLVVLGVEDQRARRRRRGRPCGGGTRAISSSSTSATPAPVFAEMRRTSSGCSPIRSAISSATRSGSAPGRSILFRHRDQLEPGVDGQVGVGDGLGLDALGGVDDQQRALARGERARDLVGEVDVARACRSGARPNSTCGRRVCSESPRLSWREFRR